MSTQEVTIKCGSCKVPVEGPADAKDEDVFACPQCGNSDTVENILAEAQDSAMDQFTEQFDGMVSDMAKKSRFMSYKPGPRNQKPRRFIVEVKL